MCVSYAVVLPAQLGIEKVAADSPHVVALNALLQFMSDNFAEYAPLQCCLLLRYVCRVRAVPMLPALALRLRLLLRVLALPFQRCMK